MSDIFNALLIPTSGCAKKVVELRTYPQVLSKEVFSVAFNLTPFNRPEFTTFNDQRKVFDLEETIQRIAKSVFNRSNDLPDNILSGRISLEEIQVLSGRPFLPLGVVESAVNRILNNPKENKLGKDFDVCNFLEACAVLN